MVLLYLSSYGVFSNATGKWTKLSNFEKRLSFCKTFSNWWFGFCQILYKFVVFQITATSDYCKLAQPAIQEGSILNWSQTLQTDIHKRLVSQQRQISDFARCNAPLWRAPCPEIQRSDLRLFEQHKVHESLKNAHLTLR